MTLGEKVRDARRSMGRDWTQERLTSELLKAGLKTAKRSWIASLETDRARRLTKSEFEALEKVLNKPAGYFQVTTDSPSSAAVRDEVLNLEGYPVSRIPIHGRVSATGTDYAPEDPPRGFTEFVMQHPRSGNLRALVVDGACMEPTMRHGDFIIVRDGDIQAKDRDVVVALVDGQTVVKRYFRAGSVIELRPDNPDFKAIRAAPSKVQILAVVYKVVSMRNP